MPDKSVFRNAALDRLASPERLEQLVQVTSAHAWLALASLAVLIVALTGWSIVGRINTRAEGRGILLGGEVSEVVAGWPGRVITLHASTGQEVAAGDLVVELEQPELIQRIENAKARVRDLQREHEYVRTISNREMRIQRAYYAALRENVERKSNEQEELLRLVTAELERQQQLLADGNIPEAQIIAAQQSFSTTRAELASARAELAQVQLDEVNAEFVIQQRLITSEQALHEAEREVARLTNDYTLQRYVHSQYNGRVLELTVDEGSVIVPGQSLMKISPGGREIGRLRAVVYVGGTDAKRVEREMIAQISPSTVRPEEHGYIIGRVERISDFPASPDGMRRVLKNDQLVGQIAALGTLFEVHVQLKRDTSTTSGYAWTSGPGPDVTIVDGTPVLGRIIVESRRPVQVVIPGLKKMLALH